MNAAEAIDAILYFDNLGELLRRPRLVRQRRRTVGDEAVARGGTRARRRRAAQRSRRCRRASPRRLSRLLQPHPREPTSTQSRRRRPSTRASSTTRRRSPTRRASSQTPSSRSSISRALPPVRGVPRQGDAPLRRPPQRSTRRTPTSQQGHRQGPPLRRVQPRSGIPSFLLRDDRALRLEDVLAFLEKRLIGQRAAARLVAETVCVVKAQLQPAGKPLACFLFVGPTGVGKTRARARARSFLFGSAERLVRFDMSEFADPSAAERLIRRRRARRGRCSRARCASSRSASCCSTRSRRRTAACSICSCRCSAKAGSPTARQHDQLREHDRHHDEQPRRRASPRSHGLLDRRARGGRRVRRSRPGPLHEGGEPFIPARAGQSSGPYRGLSRRSRATRCTRLRG